MTDQQHPITLPPELRQLWAWQAQRKNPRDPVAWQEHVAIQAARWGADQQLERDAKWLDTSAFFSRHLTITPPGDALREAMRPKPPSLKEQALEQCNDYIDPDGIIRRALESLPD